MANASNSTAVASWTSSTTKTYDKSFLDAAILSCQVVEATLLFIALWVFTSMIVYGTKTKQWARKPGSPWLNSRTFYIVCVGSVAWTIPRFAWVQYAIQAPRTTHSYELCEVILDISVVTYTTTVGPVYFFLWLKQRTIYADPTIRKSTGKCANYLSLAIMPSFGIGALVLVNLIAIPKLYRPVPQGCNHKEGVLYQNNFIAVIGGLAATQFASLCLFIYPLVKNRMARNKTSANESSKLKSISIVSSLCPCGKQHRMLTNIEKVIYRSVICTCVVVSSDVVTMLTSNLILPIDLPAAIGLVLYDISILINVLSMLATFGNYKEILTVMCGCVRGQSQNEIPETQKANKRYNRQGRMQVIVA